MKRIIVLGACCFLVAPAVWAAKVEIGGANIDIPAPAGYTATTSRMTKLNAYLNQAAPSSNREIIAFIPKQQVPNALGGGVPIERYFSVQAPKCCIDNKISDAWFRKLERHVETKHDRVVKEIEHKLPALMHRIESKESKSDGTRVTFSKVHLIPLPVFDETKNSISYSMIFEVTASSGHGKLMPVEKVVAVTIIHVKHKAIVLYCFAGKDDLKWSQDVSSKWAAAIIAANS